MSTCVAMADGWWEIRVQLRDRTARLLFCPVRPRLTPRQGSSSRRKRRRSWTPHAAGGPTCWHGCTSVPAAWGTHDWSGRPLPDRLQLRALRDRGRRAGRGRGGSNQAGDRLTDRTGDVVARPEQIGDGYSDMPQPPAARLAAGSGEHRRGAAHAVPRRAPCWASGCGWRWWGRAAISTGRRVAR